LLLIGQKLLIELTNNRLEPPWLDHLAVPTPNSGHNHRILLGDLAPESERIRAVQVVPVVATEKEIDQRLGAVETLNDAVHEAGVSQVVDAAQARLVVRVNGVELLDSQTRLAPVNTGGGWFGASVYVRPCYQVGYQS